MEWHRRIAAMVAQHIRWLMGVLLLLAMTGLLGA
jgi:hypothetical protein